MIKEVVLNLFLNQNDQNIIWGFCTHFKNGVNNPKLLNKKNIGKKKPFIIWWGFLTYGV